jgi:hypothetical protein
VKIARTLAISACAFSLASCARSAVMPLAGDTIRITTSAAPVCGRTGAQDVAVRRAGIETINRGFDKFLVLGSEAQNNVRVVGSTSGIATTYGSATANRFGNTVTASGQSTTVYTPGAPIIGGSHDQGMVIKMFRATEPEGSNAIDARALLGPTWHELIKQNAVTTCT